MLLLALLWLAFTAFPTPHSTQSETGFISESKSWAVILQSSQYPSQHRISDAQLLEDDLETISSDAPNHLLALFAALVFALLAGQCLKPLHSVPSQATARDFFQPLLRAPPKH
jgi:hypothetical protein